MAYLSALDCLNPDLPGSYLTISLSGVRAVEEETALLLGEYRMRQERKLHPALPVRVFASREGDDWKVTLLVLVEAYRFFQPRD